VNSSAEACLKEQEALALVRLRTSACKLKDALIDTGSRTVREHPWALTSAGLCAGFILPFLLPERRWACEPSKSDARNDGGEMRRISREARTLAVDALTEALVVSVCALFDRKRDARSHLENGHEHAR
jgi:hypothetical protein